MSLDTIYALSSGRGRAGIAVIRLSGPRAWPVAKAMTGMLPENRRAVRCCLRDPETQETLDSCLCIGFLGPTSFTGEDVVEFQIHGGLAVIAGVLEALGRQPGLRLSEPGEFTRRAFENGRIDLTGAESIGDLIDAETAAQRRQALRQGDGALARRCEEWRDGLVSARAYWEAALDFSDEELPAELETQTKQKISTLLDQILEELNDGGAGERLRDGLRVAIVGPPNAGKSSLLNTLAARDVAIVSNIAGTTRDILEVHMEVGGFPVILADTAGLRNEGGELEKEGVSRARHRAAEADLRVAVFDVVDWPGCWAGHAEILGGETIAVINKIDLMAPLPAEGSGGVLPHKISVKTGEGIAGLIEAIGAMAARGIGSGGEPVITRARHREALQACANDLRAFLDSRNLHAIPEVAGEHLRRATHALARVTGRVDVEDLLDVIFQDFCIGK